MCFIFIIRVSGNSDRIQDISVIDNIKLDTTVHKPTSWKLLSSMGFQFTR